MLIIKMTKKELPVGFEPTLVCTVGEGGGGLLTTSPLWNMILGMQNLYIIGIYKTVKPCFPFRLELPM
jgi:hypothetical protein